MFTMNIKNNIKNHAAVAFSITHSLHQRYQLIKTDSRLLKNFVALHATRFFFRVSSS